MIVQRETAIAAPSRSVIIWLRAYNIEYFPGLFICNKFEPARSPAGLLRKKLGIHAKRRTAFRGVANGSIVVLAIDQLLQEGLRVRTVSLHMRVGGTGCEPGCGGQ